MTAGPHPAIRYGRPRAPAGHGQDGATALLSAMVGLLTMVVGLTIVALAADLGVTVTRARAAADAAALAAIGRSPLVAAGPATGTTSGPSGSPRLSPWAAAGAASGANGADLIDLDDTGWPVRVVVEVRRPAALPFVRRLWPGATERAAAALSPRAAPLRSSGT